MFQQLLVPLDGSSLAEAALPAAAYLARLFGARVMLLHVIERNPPQEIHGEPHLADLKEAQDYLDTIARRAFPEDIQVESHVHTSEVEDVARSLSEHTGEMGSDLIVMCTHGRGGLRSWIYGSIAQQVLALGTTPVLLIQPTQSGDLPRFDCRNLLVPLDGNPDHEQGLPTAFGLAQVCVGKIHLLMVVHTTSTLPAEKAATALLLPRATSAMLELSEQSAEEYLQQLVEKYQTSEIPVTTDVKRGDPASMIVNAARQVHADLIVVGTHGKTGTDAFWSGSVTPKISSQTQIPLLLVPVRNPEEGDD